MALAAPLASPASPSVASQWISANAGSGKTTVLTRQVVKLLLLGVPPERICCITYTKAAAGEMRARILKSLRQLMLASDDEVTRIAAEHCELAMTPDMLRRARTLFGTVLDSPTGGIQLTTIHGFCQQILRAFPLEAGVAPHFTVADDLQAAQLHQQVKNRLLASNNPTPELSGAIALLAERIGESRFDLLMKSLLQLDLPRGDIKSQLYAALDVPENATEDSLAQAVLDCLNDAQKNCLRGEIARLQSDKAGYKQKLGHGGALWLEGGITIGAWLELFLTKKLTPIANLQKGEFASGTPFGDCIAHCIASAERYLLQRAALNLAEESMAAITLAERLQRLYAEAKAERGVLDYADLITKTRELLTLNQMVGWVMSKLDHRIDHLLVDEAQDTSAEQWRIVEALVDELKDEALHSANVPRTLFVVGDKKQSIFSFQGAAPELYVTMHQRFTELLEYTATPLQSRPLLASYRSAPAVLRAVDEVGNHPDVAAAFKAGEGAESHIAIHQHMAGEVVLHPVLAAAAKIDTHDFAMPKEYAITRSTAQLLAEHIAGQVKTWIDQKQWAPGDILVLTRNRKPIVQPLLRALQRRGVPVAGIDRLVLSANLAVKDLFALARWSASTHDNLALAQVLRSPLLGWSDEQLRSVAVGRGTESLWSRVRETPVASTLERWRNAAGKSAYDFLTTVLEVDGARTRFVGRFGEEVHEILDELKEQAMAMPAGLAPSTANFTAWVAGSDRQIKREQEAGTHDHVRVMTVHGAKGLEAPCVLMVDTVSMPTNRSMSQKSLLSQWTVNGQRLPLLALSDIAKLSPAWQQARRDQLDAERREYYRLLYVAMTRPSHTLHVFAAEPPVTDPMQDGCWYKIIEQALTAMPDTIERDGCKVLANAGTHSRKPRAVAPQQGALPGWTSAQPAKPTILLTLSPSGLGREVTAPFKRNRGESARERGVRIHRILQFLEGDTSRAQLDELIRHLAPDWDESEQQRASREIWTLYEKERWLWQHEAQAEANISGTIEIMGQRYPVFGQIDRLVITPSEIVVLDYKTGRDVPASPGEVGEGYLLQLKLYHTLLETLYPGKRVRPAIIWTANAQLMWLDEAVSSIDWEQAQLPVNPLTEASATLN